MELKTALKYSGAAHGGLLVWALVAGWFSGPVESAMDVADVTVISGAEFAALVEQAGRGEIAPEPQQEAAPQPRPDPAPQPAPEPPADLAPQPEPAPEAPPEPQQDTAQPAPQPVPSDAGTVLAPDPGDAPPPAPRVAPRPADRPAPDAAVAPDVQEAAVPVPAPEAAEPREAEPPQAPEEATTRIVTEATDVGGAEQIALAPAAASRPRSRPDRPSPPPTPAAVPAPAAEPAPPPQQPAPAPQPEPQPDPQPAPDPLADAIAGAVADALAGGGAATGDPGPPMTAGERDALRLAVQSCWVVDVGSESADVTVTVGVEMTPEGRVVDGSLRMVEATGGSDAAIQAAFQSARRAILRCQGDGYDLPPEKYPQWQRVEMVFNPEGMRLR